MKEETLVSEREMDPDQQYNMNPYWELLSSFAFVGFI